MPSDPFYRTPHWRALCAEVARRSGGKCEVPGCSRPGKVVDHILARRAGGADHARNLRHLCRVHDNRIKEAAGGERRSGGLPLGRAVDRDGYPIDPNHPANRV